MQHLYRIPAARAVPGTSRPVVPFRGVSETVIPFASRRRESALALQKLPHVIGAMALLADGLMRAQHETQTYGWALAGAEVLTSALVILAYFRSLVKASRNAGHERLYVVDWVDLLLAGMLAVEAVSHHYETARWPRPTLFMSAAMLVLALSHGPISAFSRRRRGLVMSNKGISVSGFTADWSELKPIVVTERAVVLETMHGVTHRLDLSDLGNEQEVRQALREAEVLRTAKRRFTPKAPPPPVDPNQTLFIRPPQKSTPAPVAVSEPTMPIPPPPPAARGPKPPTLIERPMVVQAVGNKPKKIEEYAGRVNSGHDAVSVARMVSPEGWVEPGQQPEFEEITLVLRGMLRVEFKGGAFNVRAGQAIVCHPGEWIRYSSPDPGGAEYVAICLPAFSPGTVHRDAS
jgi:quercetin dioxygenase-like cupin family protein